MATGKNKSYFDIFTNLAEFSWDASLLLDKTISNFHAGQLQEKVEEMGQITQKGYIERLIMIKKLDREFITPFDREDIMVLTDAINHVTETIEEALLKFYMFHIQTIRQDAVNLVKIVVRFCHELKRALKEFSDFKSSSLLRESIVKNNRLAGESNRAFIQGTKKLFLEEREPLYIFIWYQILHSIKKCCNACTNAISIMERVIIKSS